MVLEGGVVTKNVISCGSPGPWRRRILGSDDGCGFGRLRCCGCACCCWVGEIGDAPCLGPGGSGCAELP